MILPSIYKILTMAMFVRCNPLEEHTVNFTVYTFSTETVDNYSAAASICNTRQGQLLNLETKFAAVFLHAVVEQLTMANYGLNKFFTGLSNNSDMLQWGCSSASDDFISMVLDEVSLEEESVYSISYRPDYTGLYGEQWKGDWTNVTSEGRFICQTPSPLECKFTIHRGVKMGDDLLFEVISNVTMEICRENCLYSTNGTECWFFKFLGDGTCTLWFSDVPLYTDSLDVDRSSTNAIYYKVCFVILPLEPSRIPDVIQVDTFPDCPLNEDEISTVSGEFNSIDRSTDTTKLPDTPSLCVCACGLGMNQSVEEKAQFTQSIVANLTIDTKNTSANLRRYSSAKDDRPSAQNIGGSGAVLLAVALSVPVLFDSITLVRFVSRKIKKYKKRRTAETVINVKSCNADPN